MFGMFRIKSNQTAVLENSKREREASSFEVLPSKDGGMTVELRSITGPYAGNTVRILDVSESGAYFNIDKKNGR